MSAITASAIALALYGAALAPVAWLAKGAGGRFIAPVCGALIVIIAVAQTGMFAGSRLTPAARIAIAPTKTLDDRCARIRELMREAGLSVDVSDPAKPRIAGRFADQLPAEVQEAVAICITAEPGAVGSADSGAGAGGGRATR